ncbi:hypothetical protein Calab_1938 [Caldithrix abyssi DSM 13497]|uniref:DUF3943 domain-containing protein n=2 Tax=Caldithrix abyssi DSM 13497 TaxID=880073 RepID=H1XU62_CALAY|nr:DUF3943 domain-containing protein [Caldithrix abyssi]EHO41552.1 hypothetical protein Calab_1938 [Caldithrix abyssi DSM 13497]
MSTHSSGRFKRMVILLIFLVVGTSLRAQPSARDSVKTNYWLPAAETVGLNVMVWSFDRYVQQVDWARISWESMRNNLRHGFVWDADGFETNQLFHPYSGALSFTMARSSGLDFWKSLPYSFGGSLMWELFMETEYPSMNDIITTPMSGIVLGEISYRVSNLILTTGERGFWRNLASAFISPSNAFNRLLRGGSLAPDARRHPEAYRVDVAFGLNGVFIDQKFSQRVPHVYLKYRMEYGDHTHPGKNYRPFDYFVTEAGASLSDANSILAIFANGMLFGKKVDLFGARQATIGLFKNFSFLNNRVYKISSSSVGGALLTRHTFADRSAWNNTLIVSAIVMGGVNSLYAMEVGRDYNLGPGMSVKYESFYSIRQSVQFYLRYKHYWIHPLSGAKGNEYVDILMMGARVFLSQRQSLNLEFIEYDRWSHYRDYPNLKENNFAVRVYYSFIFGKPR